MNKIILLILSFVFFKYGVTQLNNITYLKINSKKFFDVKSIKINFPLEDCFRTDSLLCYTLFIFEKGKLKREIIFDESISNDSVAKQGGYEYTWIKDKVKYRNGGEYFARQKESLEYKYKENKLEKIIFQSYLINNSIKTGSSIEIIEKRITNYKYDLSGNLMSEINPDNKIFYIYEDNKLVGFYPKIDTKNNRFHIDDSIYGDKYINEVSNLGFYQFKKRYLNSMLYEKITQDCFTSIPIEYISINDIPIKEYLSTKGISIYSNLIIEILDNYFLFYHLKE